MRIPIAQEGFPFILGLGGAGLLFLVLPFPGHRAGATLFLLLSAFCLYFFRDPERERADDYTCVLAPGDGRILEVGEEDHPLYGGRARVIRIFLSIFDVHVQRAPISGTISKVEYCAGKFLDARDPRACRENERNAILIQGDYGRVVVTQIAGWVARRIACRVRPGQSVRLGQRLGLIRFGSQVDLHVSPDAEVCVRPGDRVVGGKTIVAINREAMKRHGLPALEGKR